MPSSETAVAATHKSIIFNSGTKRTDKDRLVLQPPAPFSSWALSWTLTSAHAHAKTEQKLINFTATIETYNSCCFLLDGAQTPFPPQLILHPVAQMLSNYGEKLVKIHLLGKSFALLLVQFCLLSLTDRKFNSKSQETVQTWTASSDFLIFSFFTASSSFSDSSRCSSLFLVSSLCLVSIEARVSSRGSAVQEVSN